jgi:hypothetical protein
MEPVDVNYREAARDLYPDVEVDNDAVVSHAEDEDGAYVQAWVWVRGADVD